jgi:hypothetical protein
MLPRTNRCSRRTCAHCILQVPLPSSCPFRTVPRHLQLTGKTRLTLTTLSDNYEGVLDYSSLCARLAQHTLNLGLDLEGFLPDDHRIAVKSCVRLPSFSAFFEFSSSALVAVARELPVPRRPCPRHFRILSWSPLLSWSRRGPPGPGHWTAARG